MAKILLEMKNITKTFPGVKALDDVNLRVEEGEIHVSLKDERTNAPWYHLGSHAFSRRRP